MVVSRQALIDSKYSTVICAPVFSRGQALSGQVAIALETGLKHEGWIMCDNLVSLRKTELTHYIGSISGKKLDELRRSLAAALGLD